MEMAMNPNVLFYGGPGGGGGFGHGPGGPGGFGHGPHGPGGPFGGPGPHGPGGFGHGPHGPGGPFGGPGPHGPGGGGFFGHGPHGPGGPFGPHGPHGPGFYGGRFYGGNPMMYHHSFHGPGFYGFMHAPGFYYAGPMHHHHGGWSLFGPFWGYSGYYGPEFYFGRPRDPFGPYGGHFHGAYYYGWWRGYGWHHPRTWCGGWLGLFPMGSRTKDVKKQTGDNAEQSFSQKLTSGLIVDMAQPKKSLFERIADWWDSL